MKLYKKIGKILFYFLGTVILLFLILVIAIQIPKVQNYVKDQLISYLEDKIETNVDLEYISIKFPNRISLNNLYIEEKNADTLLFAHQLDVGINMFKLLDNTADITSITVDDLQANVSKDINGKFNFQYIIDAFATEDEDTSPSKPFVISLNSIDLTKIHISYTDLESKNSLDVLLNELSTEVDKFDLENNSYGIDFLTIDGLKFSMNQDIVEILQEEIVPVIDSVVETKPMQIALGPIKITQTAIDYKDLNTQAFLSTQFDELFLETKNINLNESIFDIESVLFKNANINAQLFLNATDEIDSEEEVLESSGIQLKVDELVFDNINAHYQNLASKTRIKDAIDFDNIKISSLSTQVENIEYNPMRIAADIRSFVVKEQSGLEIDNLRAQILYGENETHIKNLLLETPQTLLRDQIVLTYDAKDDLTNKLEDVNVNLQLTRSHLSFIDVLKIAPQLKNTVPFSAYPTASLYVDTSVRGNLKQLFIDQLELRGLDNSRVKATGIVRNVMNPDAMSLDLKVKELTSTAKVVHNILPKNTLPSNIQLPTSFSLAGTLNGSLSNIKANVGLKSTFGNAHIKALFDQRFKNREKYNLEAQLNDFNVGKLISNNQLGEITAKIILDGQSLDFSKANASFNAEVSKAEFNSYTYQNILANGKINDGKYNIDLLSQDINAQINLNASGTFNGLENSTLVLNGKVDKINLKDLNFTEEVFSIAGSIDGDFQSLDVDALNGHLFLENFALSDGQEIYPLQEVRIFARSNEEANVLQFNSQLIDLQLIGKYKLTQISESLLQTINTYYQFTESADNDELKIEPEQYFALLGAVKDDDLVRKFLPELTYYETINLVGNYNADDRLIVLNATIPIIEYGTNTLTNVLVNLENPGEALALNANIGGFRNETFALNELNLGANVADNQIKFDLSVLDFDKELQYYIGGLVDAQGEETQVMLDPSGFKLNYEDWTVSDDNYLALAANGLYAHNILLTNDESQIKIHSDELSGSSPLNIDLKDFKIETITKIIQTDSLLASGLINGTAQLKNLHEQMSFDAAIDVSDLAVFGNPVGNLALRANNDALSKIDANIVLSENANDMEIDGFYNTEAGTFDFDLNINALQMQSLQGFSFNQINSGKGYLSGKLKATGSTTNPSIIGDLKFNDVGLNITQLNTGFQNINDIIELRKNGIYFNQFKINDAENNALVIDGNILTQNYQDFQFGLRINGDDFKVVNSDEDDNDLMYGIMAVDVNLNIRGNLDLPKVDGRITVTDQTDFTFILPQSSPALQEREGIIEFIDQDQVTLLDTLEEDELVDQTIKGLDVNVNISVVNEAKLSIIIDKTNGDFVKLQGEAELTGGIDPSGKMTLLGRYEVEEGAYEMSVSLLRRKFDIQSGSSITWTGEPMKADVDITAIYTTKTAPLDLVQQQLTDVENINMYKQQIPFHAHLIMKGELLKPEITFDIQLDENNPSVPSTVISDVKGRLDILRTSESEMNKQVFALLLLNRFVGENPFESSTGLSAEGVARQSVSRLLSQQLNNLAGELIAGVELDFDLESTEDFSTGERSNRTDLNVGVSKRLLDDRLKVSIGSNFGLEGQERQNERMTNIAGDINIEYQLSKDGRYLLRAYRKDEYQVALQGQIIETGVGFVLTIEYDKFKEILLRRKNRKDEKRNIRARDVQSRRDSLPVSNAEIKYTQPIIKEDETL